MITKTEKQLIHLTKMNSDDGFAELARRYQPLMYKLASEFIDGGRLSPDELPDLMQEMLMTLHRVANTFDQKQGEVAFGLYLKICLNELPEEQGEGARETAQGRAEGAREREDQELTAGRPTVVPASLRLSPQGLRSRGCCPRTSGRCTR